MSTRVGVLGSYGAVFFALTLFGTTQGLAQEGALAPQAPEAPTYVGDKACETCHGLSSEHFANTIHAEVFTRLPPSKVARGHSCEACHGPGSIHDAIQTEKELAIDLGQEPDTGYSPKEEARAIIGFSHAAGYSIDEQNAQCLDCHRGGELIEWTGSVHEIQQLGCADCHNPMATISPKGLLRTQNGYDTCFSCHPRTRVEFRKRSHMPLFEGKISCANCHNPHGSQSDGLVAADSVNLLCYECHPSKRGPYLWEHAPVTDNCLNCHQPHGSNHLALLTATPPLLCQSCHARLDTLEHVPQLLTDSNLPVGAAPDERLMNRGCVNCHSLVHGSNHPSGVVFQR